MHSLPEFEPVPPSEFGNSCSAIGTSCGPLTGLGGRAAKSRCIQDLGSPDQGRGRMDRGRGRRCLQGRQENRRPRSPRQPRRPRNPGRLRSPGHPPLEIYPRSGVATRPSRCGSTCSADAGEQIRAPADRAPIDLRPASASVSRRRGQPAANRRGPRRWHRGYGVTHSSRK